MGRDTLKNTKPWISYCYCLQFNQGVVKMALLIFFVNQTSMFEMKITLCNKSFLKFFLNITMLSKTTKEISCRFGLVKIQIVIQTFDKNFIGKDIPFFHVRNALHINSTSYLTNTNLIITINSINV